MYVLSSVSETKGQPANNFILFDETNGLRPVTVHGRWHSLEKENISIHISQSGFGGLGVSVLATGTSVRVLKPCRSRRIFTAKKKFQHAFLRRGSKAAGPMSYFAACKGSLNGVEVVISAKFTGQYSRPIVPPFTTRISRVVEMWRRRLKCLKSGESNGSLPLRPCPGSSMPEPYQSPEWALVPVQTSPRAE